MIKPVDHAPVGDGRFGSKQGWTRRTSTRPDHTVINMSTDGNPKFSSRAGRDLRIAMVVCAYHEEILIQFLLKHYWWVNRIFVILGESLDRTEVIVRNDPRCEVNILNMPDGFRDDIKAGAISTMLDAQANNFDWFVVVDSDEFIFPAGNPLCTGIRDWLARLPDHQNAVNCFLSNVYRHKSEGPLDLTFVSAPPILQRRHGIEKPNLGYVKPNVIRPGIQLDLGHHTVRNGMRVDFGKSALRGAHWAYADESFAFSRSVEDRTNRMHPEQYKHNWGNGHYGETTAKVAHVLKSHENDPQII